MLTALKYKDLFLRVKNIKLKSLGKKLSQSKKFVKSKKFIKIKKYKQSLNFVNLY